MYVAKSPFASSYVSGIPSSKNPRYRACDVTSFFSNSVSSSFRFSSSGITSARTSLSSSSPVSSFSTVSVPACVFHENLPPSIASFSLRYVAFAPSSGISTASGSGGSSPSSAAAAAASAASFVSRSYSAVCAPTSPASHCPSSVTRLSSVISSTWYSLLAAAIIDSLAPALPLANIPRIGRRFTSRQYSFAILRILGSVEEEVVERKPVGACFSGIRPQIGHAANCRFRLVPRKLPPLLPLLPPTTPNASTTSGAGFSTCPSSSSPVVSTAAPAPGASSSASGSLSRSVSTASTIAALLSAGCANSVQMAFMVSRRVAPPTTLPPEVPQDSSTATYTAFVLFFSTALPATPFLPIALKSKVETGGLAAPSSSPPSSPASSSSRGGGAHGSLSSGKNTACSATFAASRTWQVGTQFAAPPSPAATSCWKKSLLRSHASFISPEKEG
mmetsp:Transcript_11960/g.28959  ORF Transcript_11960/g.28959 Transcript_11960/m.28959 type:complete len:446 (+) Transcript_11960:565-1902(+)